MLTLCAPTILPQEKRCGYPVTKVGIAIVFLTVQTHRLAHTGTPRRATSTRNTSPRNSSSSSGSSLGDYEEPIHALPNFSPVPSSDPLGYNMQQRAGSSFPSMGVPPSIPHNPPVATDPMWIASPPTFEGDLAWFSGGDTRTLDQRFV